MFSPLSAIAATIPAQVSEFMGKVYVEILNPIIAVGFAISILYLSYSVFKYTLYSDKLDKKKLQDSLIWSVVGVFIMASVFAIMRFVAVSITGDSSIISQTM